MALKPSLLLLLARICTLERQGRRWKRGSAAHAETMLRDNGQAGLAGGPPPPSDLLFYHLTLCSLALLAPSIAVLYDTRSIVCTRKRMAGA